jgi:rSAM-associated Gly-rich repeat protein
MMMEEPLSLRQKYLNVVSKLATPGAIGMAVLLGSAAPGAASQEPAGRLPTSAQGDRVSERLAAIREAVSEVSGGQARAADALGEQRLAWGNWGNGGGGFGFGFGRPWGNFNFGVPWNNWNNWRNGWHNWRNRWGNW